MENITALIVDDEKGVRELLGLLIEKHCKNISVIGEANDADTAFIEIQNKKPDLVFLDIQMPRGNGFSLLDKFTDRDFDVIFTTSYAEYAVSAFKANALDYLLKPYDIEDLKKSVQKVTDKRRLLNSAIQKEDIYIAVHKNDLVLNINAKTIISLEAQNNYTLIITNDGEKHLISKVLNDVEEQLSPLKIFIRIHRGIIVNSAYIKTYSKMSPYSITLTNEACYEISRRRRAEILDILKNLI
jgi:two-component system LytT family response regulator